MSLDSSIQLSVQLIAFLAIIQSLEFIYLRKVYEENGVWRWSELSQELAGNNKLLSLTFSLFLSPKSFLILNILRILISLSLFIEVHFYSVGLLFLFHILTLLRWRGTFNGGSDYMNLMVLLCLSFALYFSENYLIKTACLWYMSLQLVFSYFKAGLLKLKRASWRNGLALKDFLSVPIYQKTALTELLLKTPFLAFLGSWAVIVFEVLFPMSLLRPEMTMVFIAMGVVFHLANVYIFALNRFLLSWMSAYPALYWCSQYLSQEVL